jgi:hypothetical protein
MSSWYREDTGESCSDWTGGSVPMNRAEGRASARPCTHWIYSVLW